jgi:hypothetical protein
MEHDIDQVEFHLYSLSQCMECKHPILTMKYGSLNWDDDSEDHSEPQEVIYDNHEFRLWPDAEFSLGFEVDEEIRNYLQKARRFFLQGDIPESLMNCRKTIERICNIFGELKGKNFHEEINYLKERKLISNEMVMWAKEIIPLGNLSVHDIRNKQEELTQRDIYEIIKFLFELCNYLYLPKRIKSKYQEFKNNKGLDPADDLIV